MKTSQSVVALALFALAATVAVPGCKPKSGASCSGDKGACLDSDTAMLCIDGKFTAVECRGTTGCMQPGVPLGTVEGVTCAHDKAEKGEKCEEDGVATCSTDDKQMLKCVDGEWKVAMECSGVHGCVWSAKEVKCTGGIDEEGAACTQDDTYSCAPDKSKMLVCKDKKMTVASLCKGQHGCRLQGKKVGCDSSLAEVGDACQDGMNACRTDKKAYLECKGGKYEKKKDCKACAVFLDHIDCN